MPTPYELWLADQKRKKKEQEQGKINFREVSQTSRPQYTLPQYSGKSTTQSYGWEKDMLGGLKHMGRSYNDKFSNLTKRIGMSSSESQDFRRFLDFQHDSKQKIKMNADGTPSTRQTVRAGQGAQLQNNVIDGILKGMNQQMVSSVQNSNEKKLQQALSKVKSSATKDRPGILGFLDKTLGRIGNTANEAAFGKNFNDAQNENYRKLAEEKLKNNLKDKNALQSLQMTNTATRKANGKLEKTSDFIGNAAGFMAPYTIGGAYGTVEKGLQALNKLKTVEKGVQTLRNTKYLKPLGGNLGKDLVRGLGAGAIGGTERELVKNVSSSNKNDPKDIVSDALSKISPKNIKNEALTMGIGDAALGAVLRNLNLKGHLDTVLHESGTKKFNAEDFQKALHDTFGQKGDVSNVLADAGKEIPKPFDAKYQNLKLPAKTMDTFKPNNIPSVDVPDVLKEVTHKPKNWLNFAQSSKYQPKARMDLSPAEHSHDPLNRGQDYWQKRYEGFAEELKKNGYSPNNLSKEALDELWTHFAKRDEPVSLNQVADLAYGKGPQTKIKTFNDFNPEQRLKDLFAPKPTIKDALKADPRIAEAVKKLNAIGPKIPPKANVEDALNILNDVSTNKVNHITNQKAFDDAINELNQKYKGKGNDSKEAYLQDLEKVYEKHAPNPSDLGKNVPIQNQNPVEKLQTLLSNIKPKSEINPTETLKNIDRVPVESVNKTPKDITAPQDEHGYGLIDTQAESKAVDEAIKNIKDISPLQVGTLSPYELADRLPKEHGDAIKNSLDDAKKNYISHLEQLTNDLYNNVVKGLGIKAGSKESALVQDFGEKTLAKKYLRKQDINPNSLSSEELNAINLEQLKTLHPDEWEKIVEADQYFRDNYDNLINQVNQIRGQIYPTNPDKIVPKRNDYYHHFNELTGMEGVKNLFDTPANIDPHLEGVSPYTQPKSKFQGFMQKRMNGAYKSDAVGGYLKYIKAASHSINIDPVIPVLRNTAKTLADATEQTKNANKIIEALNDHANDIAGKTNPYDRLLQKLTGRKTFRIVNTANSRVKSNMVIGNLSSALGQLGNVPLGIAKAKHFTAPGLVDTLTQAATHVLSKVKLTQKDLSAPIYQSKFLKERYADQLFRRFDQKLLDQPKKLALWLMETADKSGTNFIWNSMYRKGLSQKVADPIKFADYETRKIVAGRGVGEVPLLQKAKTTQILAPFTLEVGNQWKVLKNMVGEKDAVGLMTFLVASYGLNKAMESIRGSGVSFDPVGAFQQGYSKDGNTEQKLLHGAASVNGEIVGNVPFGNLFTNQVNTEKKLPLTNVKIKDLFGERNPNRFGTGLTVSKVVSDPLYLLPFGASQIEKTYKGAKAIKNNGVYDNKGQLQFPTTKGNLKNIQMLSMGPSATKEAREYYNNNRRPLTPTQTKAYKQLDKIGQGQGLYNLLRVAKTKPSVKSKVTSIEKDTKLSSEEKMQKFLDLLSSVKK